MVELLLAVAVKVGIRHLQAFGGHMETPSFRNGAQGEKKLEFGKLLAISKQLLSV